MTYTIKIITKAGDEILQTVKHDRREIKVLVGKALLAAGLEESQIRSATLEARGAE